MEIASKLSKNTAGLIVLFLQNGLNPDGQPDVIKMAPPPPPSIQARPGSKFQPPASSSLQHHQQLMQQQQQLHHQLSPIQLRMMVRDLLINDGIQLSAPPYTSPTVRTEYHSPFPLFLLTRFFLTLPEILAEALFFGRMSRVELIKACVR